MASVNIVLSRYAEYHEAFVLYNENKIILMLFISECRNSRRILGDLWYLSFKIFLSKQQTLNVLPLHLTADSNVNQMFTT